MNPANIVDGTLILKEKKEVARDTLEFLFEVENTKQMIPPHAEKEFSFLPGQFVNLTFTDTQSRSYSIASAPDAKHITLLVRIMENGLGSTHLKNMKIDDQIPFRGAFGHFVLQDKPNPIVFFATGTGIAPFRSMQHELKKHNIDTPITLIYGGKDLEDIAYLDEITTWKHTTFQLGLSRSKDFTGFENQCINGRITQIAQEKEFDKESLFYLCGNGEMIKEVQQILEEKGHPKSLILSERFF